ncbi:MAG: 2'-5' RNA ligase family protein [Chloroflexota bacterium]|nr:2'-5' RNA ligase family protein [Chloroflexota bacterium]
MAIEGVRERPERASDEGQARRQDEAFRQIWQAFRTNRTVEDGRHDTEDWRTRPGPFASLVVSIPAAPVQPHLDGFRATLSPLPIVRVHPDHFLYLTLQELGFVTDDPRRRDEIHPDRLAEIAQAAAALGEEAAFTMTLGGVNSFQDAIFLDVHDGGTCDRLHTRLRELAAIKSSPRYPFLPHVTIAHYVDSAPIGRLPALLAPWRDRAFGEVAVVGVEVVTIPVETAYPALQRRAIVPLRT